jgi:hypothetical protein
MEGVVVARDSDAAAIRRREQFSWIDSSKCFTLIGSTIRNMPGDSPYRAIFQAESDRRQFGPLTVYSP